MKSRLIAFLAIVLLGLWLILSERPTGSITGIVLSQQGTPLAQARVILSGPAQKTVTTDRDGKFRVDRLPTGRYVVVARSHGYDSQWMTPAVEVKEGKVTSGVKFALMRREPTLYFANYQKVFTPKEEPRIGIRGTLIDRVGFELYRIDLQTWVRNRDSLDSLQRLAPRDRSRFEKVAEWERAIPANAYDEDDWFYRQIPVPQAKNGAYLVVARGYRGDRLVREEATWFNRTRLALVAKRSQDQLLLYAVDMLTNQPWKNVQFQVLGRRGTVLRGQTGKAGLSLQAFRGEERVGILGESGDSLATLMSYHSEENRPYQIYTYTDRPVYRPGQNVYFKGILANNRQIARGTPVKVRIKDTSDTVLYEKNHTTDAWGGYSGDLRLADAPRLGNYNVETTVGAMSEYSNFSVLEYRKDEYKLDITPKKSRIVSGETIQANVHAAYYFGAPVPGSRIRYSIYSTPVMASSEEDNFYYGFGDSESWGYGDFITEGEAVTDDQGNVTLTIPTKQLSAAPYEQTYDQRYTLEVEAVEVSQRPIRGKASVTVTRGLLEVSAATDKFVYSPGDNVILTTSVTDLEGRPTEAGIQVSLGKQESRRGEEGEEVWYRQLWTRAAEGNASLEFKAPGEGYYNLIVQSTDREGRVINQIVGVWVASGEFTSSYRYGLRLIFDKKTYRPGDIAKVIISSPVGNSPILLTQEAQTIRSAQVIPLGAPNRIIEIPITREFEPNVFVNATLIDGKAFYQAERSLNVTPERQFLNVQITPNQARYQPGEQVSLTVKLTDTQNRPVRGAFSLGVVDEAIYAVMPDETQDIRRFFHGPRYKQVSTTYSFPEDYSGGPSKDLFQPTVRENFKDTAAWFPTLVTNAQGIAKAIFTLPDNLTTWVATVRANTQTLQVGSTTTSFIETKDLLVRLITPRFLVEGDRARLGGITHNNTEETQSLSVGLEAQNLKLENTRPRDIRLQKESAKDEYWWTDAGHSGTASVTFTARGKKLGDAMRLSFPILPHAIERSRAQAGWLDASGSVLTMRVPGNIVPSSLKMRLELNTTPLQALEGALAYLSQYPYGCTEQTTSRFLPQTLTYQTLRKLGFATEKTYPAQLQQGLATLYRLQHSDGGWGWWDFGDSETEMTAYAMEGLAIAKQAGFPVSSEAVQNGIRYLKGLRLTNDVIKRYSIERGSGADTKAMVLYALSLYGDYSPQKTRLDALSNHGKALIAMAQYHLGQRDAAEAVLARLDKTAVIRPGSAYWPANGVEYSWADSDVLTTSRVFQAYLTIRPRDPKVPLTLRWLMAQKQGPSWGNTKDTSMAVMALDHYLLAYPPNPKGVVVQASLNGKPLLAGSLPSNLEPVVLTPRLATGTNPLRISASEPLAYSMSMSYLERKKTLLAESTSGLGVQRQVYSLSRKQLASHDLGKLKVLGEPLRVGDLALVELKVTNREPLRYLILESPLVGGTEVLEQTPQDWNNWYSHREVHDEKVALFFSLLPAGTHKFYYGIRAELPGEYRVLPTAISSMYLPELRSTTAEGRLVIR